MPVTHVELTESQIEEVIGAFSMEDPLGHIVRLWDFLVGSPFKDYPHPIRVQDYSIPTDQALQITGAVIEKAPQDIRGALAMEWVSKAPSAVS